MLEQTTTVMFSKTIATMKNLFKNLMLVAVAAMGFTACEQVGVESVTPVAPEVEMTVIAGMDDTRTYIDEDNKVVKWSEGDQLKVIEKSATGISYKPTSSMTIESDKALFEVSFDKNTTDVEFTYNAFYPATAVVEDETEKRDITKVKVIVKDQQNATATSFDPQADVLVAKQLEFDAQPTVLNMQFKRLVALGKMTLTGLPADAKIESVVFTAGAEDVLAGRNYVNATTGEVIQYGYFGSTNALTINYAEAISTRDIYFTCNPFEMEAGETFKVKAVCGNKSYTRKVEIPAGRSLTFTEGNLGTFSVDMTSATVESISSFAEGDYAVIAKSGTKYYAMKGVKGAGDYMTYSEVNYDGTATTFTTEDETLVWNIKAVEGGYTIQNSEGKYLSGHNSTSSNNYAYLGDAQTLAIAPVDGTNQYEVTIKNVPARILSYNSSSPRFAFYATKSQVYQLFLVPVAEDTTPRFEVGPETLEFDADANAIDDDFFTVTAVNGFDITKVTATTDAEWLYIDESEASDGIWYMCPESNEGEAREAEVVFSAEGLTKTVIVKQQAAEGVVVDTNITVAEFLDKKDTATEYTLTGKITRVVDQLYGNFDLTDETGTVYVYGLLTPEGVSQKQWAAAGLRKGDIITIKGKYSVYNDSPQVKNAIYVSHVPAPFISATDEAVAAEATNATITVESNVAWSVSCSANWVTSFTTSGENNGTITVEMEANESTENREAIFTLTSEGLDSITVKLTQSAKIVGSVPMYVKVTSAPADWSGTYLIVWGTEAHATVSGKDLAKTTDVLIVDDAIVSNTTVDAAAVTIAKTSGSNYSLKLPNGKYLSMNANSNQVAAVNNAYNLTFEYTTKGVKIMGKDTENNTRYVLKNGTYYRGYKSVGSYELPTLYKLSE